jgi:carbon storage regulator
MLVLSRRIGEEIVIAGDIRVAVVQCGKHGVRLGITAPSNIAVQRLELLAGVARPEVKASSGSRKPMPRKGELPTAALQGRKKPTAQFRTALVRTSASPRPGTCQ